MHSGNFSKIRDFLIADLHWQAPRSELSDDLPLIQSRTLDSLGLMRLIEKIETEFGISIRDEEIVGFVTRGKGVAVHAKSCPNVTNLMYEPDRRINVSWGRPSASVSGPAKATYPVKLTL